MTGESSEIARRMLFAETEDSEGFVGGRGRRVYPSSQMTNLVYFSKVVATNASLVNLVRKTSPDLLEAIMEFFLSVSDTSINWVWPALFEMDSSTADKLSPERMGVDRMPIIVRMMGISLNHTRGWWRYYRGVRSRKGRLDLERGE